MVLVKQVAFPPQIKFYQTVTLQMQNGTAILVVLTVYKIHCKIYAAITSSMVLKQVLFKKNNNINC